MENENKILKEKIKKEENTITNNNNIPKDRITELKNELEKSKKVLKSYEIQNLKLSENERKLKAKLVKELKLVFKFSSIFNFSFKILFSFSNSSKLFCKVSAYNLTWFSV